MGVLMNEQSNLVKAVGQFLMQPST